MESPRPRLAFEHIELVGAVDVVVEDFAVFPHEVDLQFPRLISNPDSKLKIFFMYFSLLFSMLLAVLAVSF